MTEPTSIETAAPAAPAALSPALALQQERDANTAAWNHWRETWTPAIPEANGLAFAKRDLELDARQKALEDGTPDPDPARSDDPIDRSLAAPAPRDVAGFIAPWEVAGRTLTPEGRDVAEVIATALPPDLYPAGRAAFERAVELAREAAAWPAAKRDDELEDALMAAWGSHYDMQMDYAEAAFNLLGPGGRAFAVSQRLGTHPEFWKDMAKLGEQFLQTDEGIRWRLAHPRPPVDFLHHD